jgi:hypothetical protein
MVSVLGAVAALALLAAASSPAFARLSRLSTPLT